MFIVVNESQPQRLFGAFNGISRRGALQGAGVGASALLLAACSTIDSDKPTIAADRSDEEKKLQIDGKRTFLNDTGDAFPLLNQFSKETGIAVTYTDAVYDDNLYYSRKKDALAMGEGIGADASVLSDWMAQRWIRLGYVQPMDLGNIPNIANVRDSREQSVKSPNRNLAVPWRSNLTGIAWRKSAFPDGLTAVSQMWSPALKGKVGVLSSMRETLGLIMLDQGVDISGDEWADAEFSTAVNTLRSNVQSGQIRSIKGNNYTKSLRSGETVATFAQASDILRLIETVGDEWEFAIPKAGGVLSHDVVVVPMGSTHRHNVEMFLNYYLDPSNTAKVAAVTKFIPPVDASQIEVGNLSPDVLGNQMIFPTPETFESARPFRTLKQDEELRYAAQYQSVMLATP